MLIQFQDIQKCLLRNLYASDLTHFLLALFLFLKKLLLPGNISAVALRQDILSQGFHGFSGNNPGINRRLNRDVKKLAGNLLLQLFTHLTPPVIGGIRKYNERQGVHGFFIYKNIKLNKVTSLVAVQFIIQRGVTPGT